MDALLTPVWFAQRHLREARFRARNQRQRLTKGYADAEVWNLDSWLCEALGTRLKYMAEHHVAYPGVGIYRDSEAWGRDLSTHADALLAYGGYDTLDIGVDAANQIIAAAQEALRWVAEWLPYCWD